MYRIKLFFKQVAAVGAVFFTLAGCVSHQKDGGRISMIDTTLQRQVASVLQAELTDSSDVISAQIIVMESETGKIKALLELTRNDSAGVLLAAQLSQPRETGLMKPISMLAALEEQKIELSDTVDIGTGVYVINGKSLKDTNLDEPRSGKITFRDGVVSNSNIAVYKAVEKAFGNNSKLFLSRLNAMGYGRPDSVTALGTLKPAFLLSPDNPSWSKVSFAWLSIGYNQLISPLQILTFFNAIANQGKMISPRYVEEEKCLISNKISSKENWISMQQVLKDYVDENMKGFFKKSLVAGFSGSVIIHQEADGSFHPAGNFYRDFCGYLPADNPKYAIFISVGRRENPVDEKTIGAMLSKLRLALL